MRRFDRLWTRRSAARCWRWGRLAATLALAAAASSPGVGSATGTVPVGAAAAGSRQVLQSFPAGLSTFEVTLEGCGASAKAAPSPPSAPPDGETEPACTFAITLLEGARVVDRATLLQPGCGPARPTAVSLTLGADRDAKAWNTSSDKCDIDFAARAVKVAGNTTALLVTQLMGSEYRYRSHRMYVAGAGKLEELWKYDDDFSGAHWTRTAVMAGSDGAEDVAFIDAARADDAVTTKVTAMRLHFDAKTGRLARHPLPDRSAPLFLLQVGQFKRVADTAARPECLHQLVILRGRLFPAAKLPALFAGAVFARRDEADAALAAIGACPGGPAGHVFEIPAGKGKQR